MTALDLAALIETRLAAIEQFKPTARGDAWGWRDYFEKVRGIIDDLVRDQGVEYSQDGDVHHFRFADIASSAFGGELQLLKRWVATARKAQP